jgi:serine/threonine-protein kinase
VTEAGHPRTLQEVLASDQPLPLERALALVRAAALAVDAVHAHQLVHASLSPSAILVDADDRVTLRPPGQRPGTADDADSGRDYWSPQRVAGEPARPADDLYVLGLIARALLTRALVTDAPQSAAPSILPPKVEAVLEAQRSWAPAGRFASGAELAHELERAAARPRASQEPAWAAARRVAQARAAHRLAVATPPSQRPRRPVRPAPLPSHPIIRQSNYPDMPLAGRWVAVVVVVLSSVYLFPLYYMLFSHG